jgi:hypothetical protein
MCGPLKPECSSERIVAYIQQYFKKATSGHGYGHAILSLPHLLVVHLPEAGRVGVARGWASKEYREALRTVDKAITSVLEIYKSQDLMKRTTVFITSLSAEGVDAGQQQATNVAPGVPCRHQARPRHTPAGVHHRYRRNGDADVGFANAHGVGEPAGGGDFSVRLCRGGSQLKRALMYI